MKIKTNIFYIKWFSVVIPVCYFGFIYTCLCLCLE